MTSIYVKTLMLVVFWISIAGCAASKQQAMLNTINSPQVRPATFEALGEDLNSAEKDRVNLIAPEKYLQAKKLYEEAETARGQGQPEEKYSGKLSDARKELDSAVAFAKENKDKMGPLMEARQTALTSGVAETTNKDLAALENKYLVLVADLDNRDARKGALERIPELTHEYQRLTIKTVQSAYLGEAENNVELAKNEGAKDLVPKTLKRTEETIKKAKDYISQDQKAASIPMIAKLGDAAVRASRRLLVMTRYSQTVKELTPEDISLNTEALLNSAGASLEGKDLRGLSFEAHAAALNESIAGLQKEHAASAEGSVRLQNNLTESQQQISELETKTAKYSQLEQKDEQNKRLDSVRGLFDETEAKVYRQGNSVVISLKKVNFPVNKSEIPSPAFGLLKKVQSAIRTFNEPSVVVEGHTDSSGDADLNKALSERRAEAVKAYLLSNSVISPEKIVAVGYGSEKPLASNKLSPGRAINRRIDIIIK